MADPDDIPEADRAEGVPHPRHTTALFGHDRAMQTFIGAAQSGRLHHGWLITGPKGIGKATFAWGAARYLIDGDFSQSMFPQDCDTPVFRRTSALAEPRMTLCRRGWDHKTKRLKTVITVDEVRKLKSFFALSATDGGWRVAIVDAADEMNMAAANALLKILEEPPDRAVILLVCHQPGRLLPTIRSRMLSLPLSNLDQSDFSAALSGIQQTDPAHIPALYELSGGAVGRAAAIEGAGGRELYGDMVAALSTLPRLDRQMISALADSAAGRGAEARYELLRDLTGFFLARAAKVAAGSPPPTEAARGESALLARLAATSRAAPILAELAQSLDGRQAHANAVNLDPALVILDTFLKIEAAANAL